MYLFYFFPIHLPFFNVFFVPVDKVQTLKRYKFSLAFENSNEDDYVTEKYFQSLVAGKFAASVFLFQVLSLPRVFYYGVLLDIQTS